MSDPNVIMANKRVKRPAIGDITSAALLQIKLVFPYGCLTCLSEGITVLKSWRVV
ncbi:MAG: hypothetical protein ACJASB_002150 [Shewanella psychromarinicola]|jgi:hypothetical protein